jgi:hypothetical protein
MVLKNIGNGSVIILNDGDYNFSFHLSSGKSTFNIDGNSTTVTKIDSLDADILLRP